MHILMMVNYTEGLKEVEKGSVISTRQAVESPRQQASKHVCEGLWMASLRGGETTRKRAVPSWAGGPRPPRTEKRTEHRRLSISGLQMG